MSATMIAMGTNRSTEWLAGYVANVPAMIRRYGGAYTSLSKGEPDAVEVVDGTAKALEWAVVFTFPSVAAIREFLASAEYAPYREARNAGADCIFLAFEDDKDAPQLTGAALSAEGSR